MSRAIVTGAAGFLGPHLVRRLLAEGREVVAVCRRAAPAAKLFGPGLEIVEADLRDERGWKPLLSPGASLFHLAAVRAAPAVRTRELEAVNVAATRRCFEAAAAAGVARIVYVSSARALAPDGSPPGARGRDARDRVVLGYEASRARALEEARDLAAVGVPLAVLLPAIVYGPDHPARPNRVVQSIRRALRSSWCALAGDGRAPRDLDHVDDVVDALLAAERTEPTAGEYVLSGEAVSPRELVAAVRRLAGLPPPRFLTVPMPLALGCARIVDRLRRFEAGSGYSSLVLSLTREWRFGGDGVRRLLGREPLPLVRGLESTIDWIRRTAAS
jgi:UDP-glucuronate 4-epimerase